MEEYYLRYKITKNALDRFTTSALALGYGAISRMRMWFFVFVFLAYMKILI